MQGLFSVGSTFGPLQSTCVLEGCWRYMSENTSVGSTFGPTRSTCEWNHCWRNISENRSSGSTCELNHFWRNMSENRTWWNQLPLDGTASHPTITSRALPTMWHIIHQCSIWEALINQFWMNITEWPRFLHPLVVYPLNPPLSTSHYAWMVDAQLNTQVSYDLWIWWKSVSYSHVIHPTWCPGGCQFTLAEISHGSSLLMGHLWKNISTSGASSTPGPSWDLKWVLDLLWFWMDPKSLVIDTPEGLSLYMGMGMFLCII